MNRNELPTYEEVSEILGQLERPPVDHEADATAVVLEICVALLERVQHLEGRMQELEGEVYE